MSPLKIFKDSNSSNLIHEGSYQRNQADELRVTEKQQCGWEGAAQSTASPRAPVKALLLHGQSAEPIFVIIFVLQTVNPNWYAAPSLWLG